MFKRSFSVVMLALMVAPTYAVYGEDLPLSDAMKETSREIGETVRKGVESAAELAAKANEKVRKVVGLDSTPEQVENKENPVAAPATEENSVKVVFDTAKEALADHVAPSEDADAPSTETEGTTSENNDAPKNNEEEKSVEAKSGFFSRCKQSVVNGTISSKKSIVAGVSAVVASVSAGTSNVLNAGLKAGKFVVATVNPRTYWNAGKDFVTGKDGMTRFAIIKGHKEAVTGIVGATILATAGYVYREEIAAYGKKAYNWTANQVQSLRNYIQG